MKIVWHMPTLRRAGCGLSKRAVELAVRAAAAGHTVRFVVDYRKCDGDLREIAGIPVERIKSDAPMPWHWSLQARARRHAASQALCAIRNEHGLLVTCQPEVAAVYGSQANRSPLVFVCGGTTLLHDATDQCRQAGQGTLHCAAAALDRTLKRRNERAAVQRCDLAVFNSVHTRERVIATYGVDPAKCFTVYGGTDSEQFMPVDASSRSVIRGRLGIPSGAFVICWSGRLSPEKHVALLIDAAARMERENLRVVLVGDGPLRKELETRVAHHQLEKIVLFVGEQRNVHHWLQAADVFAFPSRGESFGNSLAEAMNCGLPCVALRPDGRTICNASLEILDDGRCGLLVDRDDPHDFAESLERLRADSTLRIELGMAARVRASNMFTWDRASREFISLLERLANNGSTIAAWPEAINKRSDAQCMIERSRWNSVSQT